MAKTDQVLQLDPPLELKFRGPFEDVVASKLDLTNPTNKSVCFKVKTTAPRRYCVRPNSGVVKPNSKVSVMLMLQPFEFDPNEKNKHKFMVQTMYMPEGDFNLETLFREADASQLMDSKLRCVFEMPDGAGGIVAPTATQASSEDAGNAVLSDASSSLPPKSTSSSNADQELTKAADEIKRLRGELSTLRQENLKIKEEKLQSFNSGRMSGPSVVKMHEPVGQNNTTHILISVFVLVVGFVLGKWIF